MDVNRPEGTPPNEDNTPKDFLKEIRTELGGLSVMDCLFGPIQHAFDNEVDLATLTEAIRLAEEVKKIAGQDPTNPSAFVIISRIDATILDRLNFKKLQLEQQSQSTPKPKNTDPQPEPATRQRTSFTEDLKILREKLIKKQVSYIDVIVFIRELREAEKLRAERIVANPKDAVAMQLAGDIPVALTILERILHQHILQITTKLDDKTVQDSDLDYLRSLTTEFTKGFEFTGDEALFVLAHQGDILDLIAKIEKYKNRDGSDQLKAPIKEMLEAFDAFKQSLDLHKTSPLNSFTDNSKAYETFYQDLSKLYLDLSHKKSVLQNELVAVQMNFPSSAIITQTQRQLDACTQIFQIYESSIKQKVESTVPQEIREYVRRALPIVDLVTDEVQLQAQEKHADEIEKRVMDILSGKLLTPPITVNFAVGDMLRLLREKFAQKRIELHATAPGSTPPPPGAGIHMEPLRKELNKAVNAIISLNIAYDQEDMYSQQEYQVYFAEPLARAAHELEIIGESPGNENKDYTEALKKVTNLIERARFREADLEYIIKTAENEKYGIYFGPNELKNLTDPKEKAVTKRFIDLYYAGSDSIKGHQKISEVSKAIANDPSLTPQQKEKAAQNFYAWLKVRMLTHRYQDDHTPQFVPGADQTELFAFMAGKISRKDILNGVSQHPEYGKRSVEFFDYAIKVVAKQIPQYKMDIDPKTGKVRLDAAGKPEFAYLRNKKTGEKILDSNKNPIKINIASDLRIDYDTLAGDENGKDRLKRHLYDEFATKRGLPDDVFNVLWNMYEDFDLASISLVLMQKGTKTRSHNSNKRNMKIKDGTEVKSINLDPDWLSRPTHVLSHMVNRYSLFSHSAQKLLPFLGDYPEGETVETKWAGNSREYEVEDKHGHKHKIFAATMGERQKMLKLYYNMKFPSEHTFEALNGKDEHGKKVDLAKWDEAVFPDMFDFLTKPLGPNGEVRTLELYQLALMGFNNMMDIVVFEKDVSASLTDDQIFNADTGLYAKFISKGMGLAKMINGNHMHLFPAFLEHFVMMCAERYVDQTPHGRLELQEKFAMRLGTAMADGGINLSKIDLDAHSKILEILHRVSSGKNKVAKWGFLGPGGRWSGISEMFIPRTQFKSKYRKERAAFAKQWYELATINEHTGKNKKPPIGWLTSKRLAFGRDKYGKHRRVYYKIINGNFDHEVRHMLSETMIDKNMKETDTSKK